MLEETYIFYTAHNGYHLGIFRLPPTKILPYESDLRVPLIVRGPTVPKGVTSDRLTQNIDHHGAIASAAGLDVPSYLGGGGRGFIGAL